MAALRAAFETNTADSSDAGEAARRIVVDHIKRAYADGRNGADRRLTADGHGTACAEQLSELQDDLIRAAHELASETVFPPGPRGRKSGMAVIAVGGYGRGTLAPGSDIDLLFVASRRPDPRFRKIVEYILYLLWDVGFKVGHATRSIDECIRLAKADMTIRTSVLEARLICGDEPLFQKLVARFDAEVVKGTAAEFVAAKLAERDERHQRQGSSRYLVEPNVKESKGGLRDLHTLFWIAKYVYRTNSTAGLVQSGVFSNDELKRFRKAEDFLWAIRCSLHFITGRAEDRLSFDHQQSMAERLGYSEHPGMSGVERFMKHYFLVAKDVGDLTRILCSALEERHVKQAPAYNRLLGGRRGKRTALEGSDDFVIDNNRINLAGEDVFRRDPINLIRIFRLAEQNDLLFHPDATKAITRSLRLIDRAVREDKRANALFVEIATSPRKPDAVLRAMNETGVLGRFIPEFGKIVAMMQFNMYHHFTVDEHLLRAVGELSRIERGELGDEHPLATDLVKNIKDRTVLYLAVLFHDIAKGRPEDHSIAGAKVLRRLAPRLDLSPEQADLLSWLVEHHLVMSTVAQRRDLQDPKTIHDFVAIAQDIEHLRLLLILTVVDIRAVGPGVWNGWKGQLLRTLYSEAESIITGGHPQLAREQRVREAREALIEALDDWPLDQRRLYAARHYPAYLLRVDLEHKRRHADLIRQLDRSGRRFATNVTMLPFQGVTEIVVLAPDHPRLLSVVAGACAMAGANIVDAQIFTTVDGLALDAIFISRQFEHDEDEERRAERIGGIVEEALSGRIRLPEQIATKHGHKSRSQPFRVRTRIRIDNTWSNKYTAIETSGLDRPGLLFDLTRALSDLNLNIGSAHVTTYGERAVDVFYVADLIGEKVTNAAREADIRRRLADVFARPAKRDDKRGAA